MPAPVDLEHCGHMKPKRSVRGSQRRFVLGIDFGTLSARALLVDADTGAEAAEAVHEYTHGVIEEQLPGDKRRLPPETALPLRFVRAEPLTAPKVPPEILEPLSEPL